MKKTIFSFVLMFIIQIGCFAQNDIKFSNYMFSTTTYNPAMAGNSETLNAALIARQQWTGFNQSPQTQLLSLHSYVDKITGGIGLSIINDKLGFEHSTNFKLMYAYKLRLSEKGRLSFGLGFGTVSKSLKGSKLIYDDIDDEYGVYNNINKTKPDFDFGIAFHSDNFCAGISSTHIDQSLNNATVLKIPRHYYLYAEYKIKKGEDINVIPSLKIRSSQFITQFDANAVIYYVNKFWIGISYRFNDAIIGLAGVDITKNLRIGYSYDYNSDAVKSYSNGSHEIVLLTSFNTTGKKIPTKSPRFF